MKSPILVTGAGSPTAVALIQAIGSSPGMDLHAGDSTTYAGGLYLVSAERRLLLPPDDAPELVPDLMRYAVAQRIRVIVPTLEAELAPIARHRAAFASLGIEPVVAPEVALHNCSDRWKLVEELRSSLPVPRTALMDESFRAAAWRFPLVARPRHRGGPASHHVLLEPDELLGLDPNVQYVAQEFLPGPDYSVEVVGDREGEVLAAVVIERLGRGAPGSLTCRTVLDEELTTLAVRAYERLGLTYAASVQLRRDRRGQPRVIDVRPTLPETLSLVLASGVDLPRLLVASALGQRPGRVEGPIREVGMVRLWQDHFVAPEAVEAEVDDLPPEAAAEPTTDEGRPLFH